MERERERGGESLLVRGKEFGKKGLEMAAYCVALARVQTRSVAPELCARLTSNRSLPRWRPPR